MNLFNQVAKQQLSTELASKKQLDYDWVTLIMEAKSEGISVEEIRTFLKKCQTLTQFNTREK